MTAGAGYVFNNTATNQTTRRFTGLETLYDPVTCRNLTATGAGPEWRCLEVGAGGGSVARWLAGRGARVTATDINPSLCNPGPGVEVLRHDITQDPIPGEFNLIHARLVLFHLPHRREVIKKMAAALTPGGWLAIEEFDLELLSAPVLGDTPAEQLIGKYWQALRAVFTTAGADPACGRAIPAELASAGLTGVRTGGHLAFSAGGSPGADLQRANAEQTRDQLTATGLITAEEVTRLCQVLTDPAVTFMQPAMITARGQAPEDRETRVHNQ